MNRDRFNNVSLPVTCNASFAIINALQDYQPDVQMAAITAVFLLATAHHGVEPQDAFTVTKNVMSSADKCRPEFLAVRDYMQGEWKK